MLKPQLHQSQSSRALMPLSRPFSSSSSPVISLIRPRTGSIDQFLKTSTHDHLLRRALNTNIRASVATSEEKSVRVKAVVTVKLTVGGLFSNVGLNRGLDDIADVFGKSLLLELVSTELDSNSGEEKTVKAYARKGSQKGDELQYEATFDIPSSFGYLGAVKVENEHHKEMHIARIVVDNFPITGPVTFNCDSWVHSKFDNPESRVFFTNKCYLPSQTPSGLKKLRAKELETLRGNGTGERKPYDRIYDYDKYNDLGDPDDTNRDLARPVLGGSERPYPRRCRTGRPPTKNDPFSETRSNSVYVPRDETFSEVKNVTFSAKTLRSVLHALLPFVESKMINENLGFPYFTAIDNLFNEGIGIPKEEGIFKLHLPRLIKAIEEQGEKILLFETPEMIDRDKFSWFRDEEFSRQTLAGLNPYSIKLITEWPLKSKLDPKIYGPPECKITTELIEKEIRGFMTVQEALKQKRLFILDYHDLLLPYVNKVRALKDTTLYGSRTILFLTNDGTLRPLCIELTKPPLGDEPQWKHVFSPGWDSTSRWLWKLAKTHVCAHDAGYHQLVVHWLRTHCCTEPYIIAANRQLSAMHPIYRLLHPHFRYTMEINALAREQLINADGIIESCFAPSKYSIELSSVAYDLEWRFDMEALPADLIRRGMAVKDPNSKHGVKLTIEDYPFANDGLMLWDAIKGWVSDYVNHYYPESSIIINDAELQAWWTEVRTKGHGDKKDEPWWPILNTKDDLIQVLSTIIWVTSGHHAAVNFGQYVYGGYFPNRPTIARIKMPIEDPIDHEKLKSFLTKPEATLMDCFPSQIQATKVMTILDVLSSHSVDEEYLGDQLEPSWAEDPIIKAAHEQFNGKLMELDGIIDARNVDPKLLNRTGAGIVPYQLLKPLSKPGVTGMGVPNSISI